MDVISEVLGQVQANPEQSLMLGVVLVLIALLLFHSIRAKGAEKLGQPIQLRPIAAFDLAEHVIKHAGEAGHPVHLSLGLGGIGGEATAESMAALLMLNQLARKAAAYEVQPLVTVGNPTLLIAAQDLVRQAYDRQGIEDAYDPSLVRLIAPEASAYAAGAMGLIGRQRLSGNILLGAFGDEYLLMAEAGARRRLLQVAGAARPEVLPFVLATTDTPLLGEEMFAAGAYLGKLSTHVGSLLTQDTVRLLLVLSILIGVIIKSVS